MFLSTPQAVLLVCLLGLSTPALAAVSPAFARSLSTCQPEGRRCNPGGCCEPNECVVPPTTRSGVCRRKECSPVGGFCLTRTPFYTGPSFPCCDRTNKCVFPNPPKIAGVCTPKTVSPKCSPRGGVCRTRRPVYTGPELPCCSKDDKCVFASSLSINGVCKPQLQPVCLASGKTCEPGGDACCPSLSCQIVVTGAYNPDYVRRICFDKKCSTGECSNSRPCCPGYGCGSGSFLGGKRFCLAPPSVPPPRFLV